MSRRRLRWGGSEISLKRLRGWEIVEGRAESSNGLWAVESLINVRRPTMRRGRQLEVTVRWAGVNPLFGCAWGDSVLAISELTTDLRRQARVMEEERRRAGKVDARGDAGARRMKENRDAAAARR